MVHQSVVDQSIRLCRSFNKSLIVFTVHWSVCWSVPGWSILQLVLWLAGWLVPLLVSWFVASLVSPSVSALTVSLLACPLGLASLFCWSLDGHCCFVPQSACWSSLFLNWSVTWSCRQFNHRCISWAVGALVVSWLVVSLLVCSQLSCFDG